MVDVVADIWRDRMDKAITRGSFSEDDVRRAVLADKGPAEELRDTYNLPVKQGLFNDLIAVVNGHPLDGAGFAKAVRENDVDKALEILIKMENEVGKFLNGE